MNFIKKHLVFVISCAVSAILLAAAGIKLASSLQAFEREKRGLHGSAGRLQQLHARDPYPSRENVQKEAENVRNLFHAYSALNEMLARGHIEEQDMEAADFMPLLEHTLRRMRNRMHLARIVVPDTLAFGFERYAGGQLPVPEDIPRLVQQLKIIEILCSCLAEAGISELITISREVFEAPEKTVRPTRGRRGEPAPTPVPAKAKPAPDRPYSVQSFTISFRARENAIFDLLNMLARHPMFCVVSSLTISGREHDVRTRPAARAPTHRPDSESDAETTVRGQRVIVRREELEAKLNLEVYQFAPPLELE